VTRKRWLVFRLLIGLICLLFGLDGLSAAAVEEEPTISLVKTIIVRDYKGLKISSTEYSVQSGDYILKLLKQRGVIDHLVVSEEILDLVKALNPNLKNPNLIYPDQKLILPTGPINGLKFLKKPAATGVESGIPYRLQRVKEGERLVIYLRREGIPENLIFNEYMELVMRLNPQIKNRDVIYPGQLVKLPRFKPSSVEIPKAKPSEQVSEKTAAASKAKSEAKAPQTPVPPSAKKPKTKPKKSTRKKEVLALKPPQLPETETLATQAALGIIFTRIGEQFISTGQHFLPLKSGGQVTLNAFSFPIIKLRNGHRIILDLGRRLPAQVIRLIRAEWSGYTIFQTKPREKLNELLDRLIKECGFPGLYEKGQPFIIEQQIKIKLQGDWLIFPRKIDLSAGQPVILNLPSSRLEGTFPEAAAYLAEQQVKVIDFYPKGNLIGPEPLSSLEPIETDIETIISKDIIDFIMALLELLDQKFTVDLSIPVIKDDQTDDNFSLSVNIPLYFNKNGTDYLIRFQKLSKDLEQILEKQGAKVVVLNPNEGAVAAARMILSAIGQTHKWGVTLKASERPSDRNIEFVIPGLAITDSNQSLFLTPLEIPGQLASLLAKQKFRVIKFQVNKN